MLLDHAERVQQRREDHDRRPVLVVVEDRDLERRPQPLLDFEAARGGDVLEIDAAEHGRNRLHGAHDLVGVGRVEADRERVDARELLEQHRLPLHHGQRRRRADVAEPEHRRPVRDDGNRVPLDREVPDSFGVVRDRAGDASDTGRVRHGQIVAGLQGQACLHLDLAAEVGEEHPVGDLHDLDAVNVPDGGDDLVQVPLVVGEHVDVAELRLLLDADEVDRAE
jgi:hypothetical protein